MAELREVSLQEARVRKRWSSSRKIIEKFLASGLGAAEIVSWQDQYKNANSMYCCLMGERKAMGAKVRISKIKGHVYLSRMEGAK